MGRWVVTLDLSSEWPKVENKEMTISAFLRTTVEKMKKVQGQTHIDFTRWILHFEKAAEDRRFKGFSASATSKFDSIWEAFYDWCDARRVWVRLIA
jgi:hypothetical protein